MKRINTCSKEAGGTSIRTDSLLLTGTKTLPFIPDQHKSCQVRKLLLLLARCKISLRTRENCYNDESLSDKDKQSGAGGIIQSETMNKNRLKKWNIAVFYRLKHMISCKSRTLALTQNSCLKYFYFLHLLP